MSTKWGFDREDVKSALRHTLIPLVAGAAQMAFDSYTAGAITLTMAGRAAAVAVGSGLIRAVVRWAGTSAGSGGG